MISFHWSYLILVLGGLFIPVSIYKLSPSNDRFGIGALFGFLLGSIAFLISLVVFMALKLWVIK